MPVPDYSFKVEPFLPDNPLSLLKTVTPETEVMIGTTKDEGIIYVTGLVSRSRSSKMITFYNSRRSSGRKLGRIQKQLQHQRH